MGLGRVLLRNKGFLIACGIAAWAGLEVGGKGTGVLTWLFSPAPTRDQGFHPVDIVAARPKGPVRLTPAEAEAVKSRLANAFRGNVPRHERTSAMRYLYVLKDDAKCPRDLSDLVECNKVKRMELFFSTVLAAMHPASEHLLWLQTKAYERGPGRGEAIRVAVFLGADETVKLAFDLRQAKRAGEFGAFTVRAADTSGLRELITREPSDGILMVDDPGPLRTPRGGTARIDIYGGNNPPQNGIVSLVVEGDLAARYKFFSAVLGKPIGDSDASAAGPAYLTGFKVRQEAFELTTGVTLREALIDSLGAARAATARFSQASARAGRGSFYGLVIDGARYLVVDVTDPAEQKSYDFFWDGPDGLRPVAGIASVAEKDSRYREGAGGPYYLIPLAEAGSAERMVVFRKGERGAPIAGLWPLADWARLMEALVEADAKAHPDAGVDMQLVRGQARSNAWMARCERFLSAYPLFEVKTKSDEWRRAACVHGATEPRR